MTLYCQNILRSNSQANRMTYKKLSIADKGNRILNFTEISVLLYQIKEKKKTKVWPPTLLARPWENRPFCSADGNAKSYTFLGGKFANLFWRDLAGYWPSILISSNLIQQHTSKSTKRWTKLFTATQFVIIKELEATQMSIMEYGHIKYVT